MVFVSALTDLCFNMIFILPSNWTRNFVSLLIIFPTEKAIKLCQRNNIAKKLLNVSLACKASSFWRLWFRSQLKVIADRKFFPKVFFFLQKETSWLLKKEGAGIDVVKLIFCGQTKQNKTKRKLKWVRIFWKNADAKEQIWFFES